MDVPTDAGKLWCQAYLENFEGTVIRGVFSPITPWIPAWVGDVATFREATRWFPGETPSAVAARLAKRSPRGSLTYLYTIVGVPMDLVGQLSKHLPRHVELVDYRALIDLAGQKRDWEEGTSKGVGAISMQTQD